MITNLIVHCAKCGKHFRVTVDSPDRPTEDAIRVIRDGALIKHINQTPHPGLR